MKNIIVPLAPGFEENEAVGIIDVLRRASLKVITVSITNNLTVIGAHNIPLIADQLFTDADFSNTDMIVLPGGNPGTTNLDHHDGLKKQLLNFNQQGKYLGAICAAPTVLGHLGILKGHNAICYPGCESELTGATIINAPAVISKNIITGKGPGTTLAFALMIVKTLLGEKVYDQIKEGMCIE